MKKLITLLLPVLLAGTLQAQQAAITTNDYQSILITLLANRPGFQETVSGTVL
jgi:hypothetical protein